MSSSTVRMGFREYRGFALREHYLYFKILAYGIAPWLCVALNALRITPNQVTLVGIFLVVPAAICNITGHVWIGIILFHIFFMLDATDGILARATQRKSKLGAFLDDMAHHMFHVPFFLSLAYSEYGAGRRELAAMLILFAVANTLYRAQLDILEKNKLLASATGAHAEPIRVSGIVQQIKSVILGSFNFPNVLVWMTALIWSPKMLTAYFIYAAVMAVLYYFYIFAKAVRRGVAECPS